jgi:uracil-DNA glycosylase
LFTGDRSGDWLFAALYRSGFCSSPLSISKDDGLELFDCRITAVAHCAPPGNVLISDEVENCASHLAAELSAMRNLRMILALGGTAYRQVCRHLRTRVAERPPDFGHLVSFDTIDGLRVAGSYHPSQQNTFTGKLTEPMFDAVFALARETLDRAIS